MIEPTSILTVIGFYLMAKYVAGLLIFMVLFIATMAAIHD